MSFVGTLEAPPTTLALSFVPLSFLLDHEPAKEAKIGDKTKVVVVTARRQVGTSGAGSLVLIVAALLLLLLLLLSATWCFFSYGSMDLTGVTGVLLQPPGHIASLLPRLGRPSKAPPTLSLLQARRGQHAIFVAGWLAHAIVTMIRMR
jgi:hypothetical protein